MYTDNCKHPTPVLSLLFYIWMSKVIKSLCQLGSYNSMATLLFNSVHGAAFFKDKTPSAPQAKNVSISEDLWKHNLIRNIFILNWTSRDLNFTGKTVTAEVTAPFAAIVSSFAFEVRVKIALVADVDGRAFCIRPSLNFRTRLQAGSPFYPKDSFCAATTYKQDEGEFWKRFH